MVTQQNTLAFELARIEIPNEKRPFFPPLHPELLIKVAIIDLAALTNTQGVTAHETGD
jgi:hypothetical protein